jgi:predicted ester cyclase
MHFFRYKDGRVVDLWHVWDMPMLMRQLGVPAPGAQVGQPA